MEDKILLKYIDVPDIQKIKVYQKHDGYQGLAKALKKHKPDEIIELVKASGLRGRGGAGFPAGLKWSFVPKDSGKDVYLCCNADEGEPGTFKDRLLMEKNPHQLIEGIAITAYAVNCHQAYIYIRGEFSQAMKVLEQAIAEAYEHNYLGKNILKQGFHLELSLHPGAGSYIAGEETGLLESLEGKRAEPRLKPPFPASVGLFKGPTVINNVETLSNVPHIIMRGPEWFKGFGTEKSTGTKLFCLSGHINKPGVYELPMGIPLKELIFNYGGGIIGGRKLKAVIPGGSSTPVLTADQVDVAMDFESIQAAGSMLGSAGVIVMDETTCMVDALANLTRFYSHESCGQCTPCREGVSWMAKIVRRIEDGKGLEGDLELLLDICDNISFKTLCPMGDAAIGPVVSFITKFRSEFEDHIRQGRCPIEKDKSIKVRG
ncbi:MAG: NADH-quinone oxidoreductase subunit NuoF [Candidatus Aminicenantes bacterium]|nr:NADH-quinone oxidoreductase subunit NuoF [Candidatus Aminicenantes bacterium]MDH5714572.1 NADH-quinone oxidoreductase subunit NuoF [Candidatus Aminicenantes bacterium]